MSTAIRNTANRITANRNKTNTSTEQTGRSARSVQGWRATTRHGAHLEALDEDDGVHLDDEVQLLNVAILIEKK